MYITYIHIYIYIYIHNVIYIYYMCVCECVCVWVDCSYTVLTFSACFARRQWRPQGANADGSDIPGRSPTSRGPISRPWFRVTAGTTTLRHGKYAIAFMKIPLSHGLSSLSLSLFGVAGCSFCFLFSASQIAIVRVLLDSRMGSHRLCFPGRWCRGFWYFWGPLAFAWRIALLFQSFRVWRDVFITITSKFKRLIALGWWDARVNHKNSGTTYDFSDTCKFVSPKVIVSFAPCLTVAENTRVPVRGVR